MQPSLSGSELVGLKSRWRDHNNKGSNVGGRPVSIGLASTFTVEPVVPFLGVRLLDSGFSPEIEVAPFNQIHQTCLNPASVFEKKELDCICIFVRIEEMLSKQLKRWIKAEQGALDEIDPIIDGLTNALAVLRKNFGGTIIAATPPFPILTETSIDDLDNPFGVGAFHRRVVSQWISAVQSIGGIRLLDMDALQRQYGLDSSIDWRKWYLYRQPYSESFCAYLGQQLSRVIQAVFLPAKKCLAVDCDNTLWGGVVGEEGLAGLALGDEFPGSAFMDFQRLLLRWKQQGLMLAILSKNNEKDVWQVFENHDGMLLRKSDFAAWRINWEPKPANLVEIARELNIGVDSFIFVDDNPFEVQQMMEVLPDVVSVQIPEEPAYIVSTLKKLHLFDVFEVSNDDRRKTEMINAERARKPLQESMSPEQFIESLGMTVEVFRPEEEHVGRITQLINKTNQFNLTTIRRTQDEVRALLNNPVYRVYGAKIADRFGDYGITGLVIFKCAERCWDIDTYLLSCRVLGRKVETALFAALLEEAKQLGAETITARYIETLKNAPVKELLPAHGFKPVANGEWKLDIEDRPCKPDAISVIL